MSGFHGIWPSVLNDAVTAARAALRELEAKEIPAPLSRIAAYQGGKLPPPLAARLLDEVDNNEWLRDKVVESYTAAEEGPSHLFLRRPKGWWLELVEVAATEGDGREQRAFAEVQAKLKQAEAKRQVATKKATDYKKAISDLTRQTKEKTDAAKQAAERRFSADVEQVDSLRIQLAEMKSAMEELKADKSEIVGAYDALRTRVAKSRRSREPGQQKGSSFIPHDPVRLARLLDLQAAAMGRITDDDKQLRRVTSTPLEMAAGVRPDSSDAIRWLLGVDEPVVVVVDGYNAQFHLNEGDFTSGAARRALVDALKRLRTSSSAKHRIVVVYDSTLPGERVGRTSLGGVEVRFAEKDRIADEEIVEMAAALDRAVVVSSDRAVREGAEDNGAVVLWSEALHRWLTRQ